jgi:hypothetical protein
MIYRSADGVCIFYGDQEEATSVTPGQWDDSELVAKTRSFACPARACRARIFPSVSHATSSFKGLRRDAHFGGPARHGIGFGKTEKTSRHTRALWRGINETGTSCERHKKQKSHSFCLLYNDSIASCLWSKSFIVFIRKDILIKCPFCVDSAVHQ